MSSLLQTALTNRQAAAHPPTNKLSKLALSDDESTDEGDYADKFDDDEEDEMVDLQTRPGTPVPGGVKSVGLPGKVSVSGKATRDPVSPCAPRRRCVG